MFGCIRKLVVLPLMEVNEDKSNISAFYKPLSDIEQQNFCLNYGGYPRNDINVFIEAESIQVAEALSQNLLQRQGDGILESDLSDVDLVLSAKSRYAQTPSELVAFNERMLEIRDTRVLEKQQKIDFDKSLAEKEALRKSIGDSLTNEERDNYLKAKRQKEIDKLLDD